MWTLEFDEGFFYAVKKSEGYCDQLGGISAVTAYREAVRKGYPMNSQTWINNGKIEPILFSTEVQ